MSYETDRNTLGTEFVANWTATSTVHYPNQQFDRPSPDASTSAPASYVSFDVDYPEPQEQITFGGTEQRFGRIRHGVFVPMDVGDARSWELVDSLRTLWSNASLSGFHIMEKDCRIEPPLSDGTWNARVLNVPFMRIQEETATVTATATGTTTVTQAAHGFSSLDAIYHDGSSWVAAQADAAGTLADGVVTRVWSSSSFDVSVHGFITVTAHGAGAGGTDHWLSQATPGATVTTEPTTGWAQRVFYVLDANTIVVDVQPAVFL